MPNPFSPHSTGQILTELAKKGELTETHLQEAWTSDQTDRFYRYDCINRESVPFGLASLFDHSVGGHIVEHALHDFNVSLSIRLPSVLRWIADNHPTFAAVPMDHGKFLRGMLDDERFGKHALYAVAEMPWAFATMPIDERFELLERALKEFGHVIDWQGLANCAAQWSAERTRSTILKVIESPEVAGGFLANAWSHYGAWRAFDTVANFLAVVKKAARLAPFEAYKNRAWIAVKLADLKLGRDFMSEDPGWSNYPEHYIEELEPQGQDLLAEVMAEVDAGYQSGFDDKEAPLSICSREVIRRVENMPIDLDKAYKAESIAAVLIHIPDGSVGREIFERLEMMLARHSPDLVYRFALSVRWHFDRDAFRIMGEASVRAFDEAKWAEASVRESWFHEAMKSWMKQHGWRGLEVVRRRNERFEEGSLKGYDYQVSCRMEDGREHVFKLWRGLTMRGDSYSQGDIVLLPPNATTIARVVYESDRTVIHEAGESFNVAKPVTSKMRPYMT